MAKKTRAVIACLVLVTALIEAVKRAGHDLAHAHGSLFLPFQHPHDTHRDPVQWLDDHVLPGGGGHVHSCASRARFSSSVASLLTRAAAPRD